jgi:hypothetical protein
MVAASVEPRRLSAEQFFQLPDVDGYELLDGELRRVNPLESDYHEIPNLLSDYYCNSLIRRIDGSWVSNHQAVFRCFEQKDTVLRLDFSLVRFDRVHREINEIVPMRFRTAQIWQ